jgi:hypothetical protein
MKARTASVNALARPLFLGIAALLLLLFSQSALLFAVAVVLASGVALLDLSRLILRTDRIRFSFTLAVSILLGYGLGSAIYLISYRTLDATQYQYWAPQGLLFDQAGLATALAASLLAAAVLYVRAAVERPVHSNAILYSLASPKAERLLWLGVAVALLALYAGDIGYMGAFVSDTGHVSPLGTLANLMAPPLVPYTLLLIADKRPLAKRLMFAAALVLLVGVTLLLGRRYLLYVLVLSAMALHMRGYRFTKLTKRGLVAGAAFFVLAALLLYFGFNFFMALRLAVSELGRDASLPELVRTALSQLSGTQASLVQERLAENAASRPFILSYLAGLMGISSAWMPALGAEVLYSVQTAIPSILMPGKVASLTPAPEALVHPIYGIPVFDGPNSVLVAGFDDFGFLGTLVYPLGVVLLFGWFNKFVRAAVRDAPIQLFVLFALLFQLLYIEQAMGAVFVTLRNLAIVIGAAWVLGRLPIPRLARHRYDRPNALYGVRSARARRRKTLHGTNL